MLTTPRLSAVHEPARLRDHVMPQFMGYYVDVEVKSPKISPSPPEHQVEPSKKALVILAIPYNHGGTDPMRNQAVRKGCLTCSDTT